MTPARRVEHLLRAAEAIDRLGDKTAIPRIARPLDDLIAPGSIAARTGFGEHPLIGRGEGRVAEQVAGDRRLSARKIDRGGGRPFATEQLGDRHDRVADAADDRVALLGITERWGHQLGERHRPVIAQQPHPCVEGAGHRRGEQPGAGNEVEAEALEAGDRRCGRRDALAADHVAAAVFRAVDEDRGFAERAVQMRLDDLQGEAGGDRRVKGIAALFEDAHRDRGGQPMGGRDDPEGAADLGGCRKGGHLLASEQLPNWG